MKIESDHSGIVLPTYFSRLSLLLACIGFVAVANPIRAEDWAQWRGPNCSGVSTSKKRLPVTFSATENVKWSAEIGDGICSPCVAAGRVFVTSMLPEKAEKAGDEKPTQFNVFCFDAESGAKLWQKNYSAGEKRLPTIHKTNSYASATPAADAERVYVYFTRIGLVALDAKTGEQVWQQKIPEPFFVFDWGPGMSPVLFHDKLFFCQDDDLTPALYCLDKKTGKILWTDPRTDFAVSYSHPIVCETPEGPELVVAGTGKLLGYDLETGKRKWAAEVFCRNIKTTPLTQNGIVYLSVESLGIAYQWRATADANGDGKITREEIIASRTDKADGIPDAFWKKFERGDKNKDDVLEGDEIDAAFLDPTNKGGLLASEVQARAGNEKDWKKFDADLQFDAVIQAVRGGGKGDVSKTHTLWKHKTKGADHLVSPLVADGRMVLVKSNGLVSAYEIGEGKPLWVRKRIDNASTYLAAPVYGDGKVYVAAENGKIVVMVANGAEFQDPLAINDMGESSVGTPAIVDGRLYLRTRNHLYCVEDAKERTARR